jgi:Zn-dependent protease
MLQLLWQGEYAVFTLLIVALILSLTVHELGHALVAKWFGDDTAQRAGRVTLNPLAHIDPHGIVDGGFGGFWFCQTRAHQSGQLL